MQNNDEHRHWHALSVQEVTRALESDEHGLTSEEAQARLAQYGPNRLPDAGRRGPLRRFLSQFNNVIIYLLMVAAVITGLLAHWLDTAVIAAVVIINTLIGFIQEGKAERALEAIRHMLSPQAVVLRDGHRRQIAATELVPGDIVLLQSGDKVPADLRLLRERDLRIEEAVLTGESEAVEKDVEAVAADAVVGDRLNMAFSSTLVVHGVGRGVVVGTGAETEIGRISAMLADIRTLQTPLTQQMARFGHYLSAFIVVFAALTFLFGWYARDYAPAEMFLIAVGLAVAAIPEGLPAIMTITLAIGVQRMAHRHAIIRRLPAVETLGSVTVICSDKTGTLTRNEMSVQCVALATRRYGVTGEGYTGVGAFVHAGAEIDPEQDADLMELLRAALLCNDARLDTHGSEVRLHGDPTEGALLSLALKGGYDRDEEHGRWPRVDAIPFESQHQFMATLHHDHEGHGVIYLKGAPEKVIAMCALQRTPEGEAPLDAAHWHSAVDDFASEGQRVLAIAYKRRAEHMTTVDFADVEDELVLLGLCGMMDPPRQEAVAAVRDCQSAGIRVKMITGDHALTASAIGARMNIGATGTALTGRDLEALDDQALEAKAQEHDVFARTSPEHKLRLVRALQARGEVVAMTGDGVNDAPALKRANIGIAMGIKGTEVTKEAAEMVLTDDNFASIAHAVEEGRTVYENIRKAILFILPTNGGQALVVLAAVLLGVVMPTTPAQILWVNMVTAVTLALALAFEPPESDIMRRPPRDPRAPLLSPYLIWRIGFVSVLLVAGTFSLFLWKEATAGLEAARAMAVNTLVMGQVFYLFSVRYVSAPSFTWEGLRGNRYVLYAVAATVALQLTFTYAPFMVTLFGIEPLPAEDWLLLIGFGVAVFVLVELEKAVVRGLRARAAPRGRRPARG
ncbi:cation-transporting P-type ATPase [Ectothiorhodospiraceae bacterium 2226]|nr:cation-transporting P-type ATPase [Ectothiorhodospiraceae bacterium 2226]